jgi:hypothetical protein
VWHLHHGIGTASDFRWAACHGHVSVPGPFSASPRLLAAIRPTRSRRTVKATLLAPLLKVNADVDFRQQSRADDRGRRSGGAVLVAEMSRRPTWACRRCTCTARPLGTLMFLASLSTGITGQVPAIGGRRGHVPTAARRLEAVSTIVLKNESRAVNLVLGLTDTRRAPSSRRQGARR